MEYTIHLGDDTLKQLDEIVNGGGESGGGGSSDFSTAKVTITDTTNPKFDTLATVKLYWPVVYNDVYAFLQYPDYDLEVPSTIKIALYNGRFEWKPQASGSPFLINPGDIESVGGNIVFDRDNGTITITGDCTIYVGRIK